MAGRRRSADEVRELIEDYRSSGETQKQFSARTGIPTSTLGLWLRRDRERPSTALVAIAPTADSAVLPDSASPLVLHIGNARLEIPRDLTPEELSRIRKAFLACSA